MTRLALLASVAASLLCSEAFAYSLFDPVPSSEMRPMATDRPDMTESYQSVDAGHLQAEIDGVVWSMGTGFSRNDPMSISVLGTNFKFGLTDQIDLQLVLPVIGWEWTGVTSRGAISGGRVRLKWNLVGNDGGDFGLALMPQFGIDPNTGAWDAGIIVPIGFQLPGEVSLATMVQADLVPRETSFTPDLLFSLAVGRALWGPLGAYLETFGRVQPLAFDDPQWALSGGLTYQVAADVQLDAGTRVDLLANAPVADFFVGFSIRR